MVNISISVWLKVLWLWLCLNYYSVIVSVIIVISSRLIVLVLCWCVSIQVSYIVVRYMGNVSICLSVFIQCFGCGSCCVSVGMKFISRNGSVRLMLSIRNIVSVVVIGVVNVQVSVLFMNGVVYGLVIIIVSMLVKKLLVGLVWLVSEVFVLFSVVLNCIMLDIDKFIVNIMQVSIVIISGCCSWVFQFSVWLVVCRFMIMLLIIVKFISMLVVYSRV